MMFFQPMQHDHEWLWIRKRAMPLRCQDTQGIVAYDGNGKIAAVVVFDSFTVDGCSVHFAIDNPMAIRRGLINEACHYAFVQRNCTKMFGLVPDNKEKVFNLDRKIGFYEVTRIPDALQDGYGYIVMRMDRKDCKWLPEELRNPEEKVAANG